MEKTKNGSVLNAFIAMFVIYAVATLAVNATITYLNQVMSYHQECENNLKDLTNYLNVRIEGEGEDFSKFKKYFEGHHDEMMIPYDFDGDYTSARRAFFKHFYEKYPGKEYGKDVMFEDLDEAMQLEWAEYMYMRWFTEFQTAKDEFGLSYVYFVYPTTDINICYMLDAVRMEKEVDGKKYLYLGDEGPANPEKLPMLWEAWVTGTNPSGFDIYDNDFGHTYSYYSPVVINGEKIGLVCADISVESVNDAIMKAVINQLGGSITVLVIGIIIMLAIIRSNFLSRIISLERSVREYTVNKDEKIADEIRAGIKGTDEISSLSDQFADMIKELKDYMKNLQHVTAEKERIGAELNVATQIQADMLPRVFPAFPDRNEFDIYATMNPAKEVGGDFYDFFMADNDHLALVIADVSGKGVPAALFMVIAKTLIKNHTQATNDLSPADILSKVNAQLCEGNEAELFVTVWFAIMDVHTGKGMAANAGHEHPTICRAGGQYELVEYKHSPAVATIEGIRFKEHEFQLYPGDTLYVYTDGVPEATNADNELYGTARMLDALNKDLNADLKTMLKNVKDDVDKFVGDAPQFDDMTMLGMHYFGKRE